MNVFGFDIIRELIRKQVFKQCMSTRRDAFSLLICFDAIKFVLLSVCTHRDDLLKNLGKTTAQECQKSTSG